MWGLTPPCWPPLLKISLESEPCLTVLDLRLLLNTELIECLSWVPKAYVPARLWCMWSWYIEGIGWLFTRKSLSLSWKWWPSSEHTFFSALLTWQMTLLINLSFFLEIMLEMTTFTDGLMFLTLDIVSFICLAISWGVSASAMLFVPTCRTIALADSTIEE